ncbi:hypothetical protein [Rhizobium sp. NXC24]|uniref:hypothetical protein n=1 Tax=Rhizobium sp. NXC24 TaxID=2048897 RepID=UPI00131A5523|nr:hypothetical protein [Rhizobium sp. NXC24]
MLAIGGKKPPHDPDRVELAQALDEIARLQRSTAEKQAAVTRAQNIVTNAIDEQDAAEQAVESARNTLRSRMVEAALTGTNAGPDNIMASAHARLVTANENLAAAQAALQVVRGADDDTARELDSAERRRDSAIARIVGGEIDRLHAEAIDLRDRYMKKLLELKFAAGIGDDQWPMTERRKKLNYLFQWPVLESPYAGITASPAAEPVLAGWRQAVEKLRHDANAPLPEAN